MQIMRSRKYGTTQVSPTDERDNKIIVTDIRCFIHENYNSWDKEIHNIAQAIRVTKHDVTGYSPTFLKTEINLQPLFLFRKKHRELMTFINYLNCM